MGLLGPDHRTARNNRPILVTPAPFVAYDNVFVVEEALRTAHVILRIPRRLLPVPASRVSQLLAVPIPAASGVGRLFAQFLITLAEVEHSDHDMLRLGHIAVDLAVALLANQLDKHSTAPTSPTCELYLRVLSFVDRNLHVPELGPAAIASAHGISVRYLHRIFQLHQQAGVTAYLRSRRLDRCRRDLADPCLDHLTIASVAARWGFTQPADFSRVFRRETGVSPSHYRAASRVPAEPHRGDDHDLRLLEGTADAATVVSRLGLP